MSPTHFVVLDDNSDIKPNLIQRFAYATTFMYFNWPGTIRVPAMCQVSVRFFCFARKIIICTKMVDFFGLSIIIVFVMMNYLFYLCTIL